jgi:hypothetical protein
MQRGIFAEPGTYHIGGLGAALVGERREPRSNVESSVTDDGPVPIDELDEPGGKAEVVTTHVEMKDVVPGQLRDRCGLSEHGQGVLQPSTLADAEVQQQSGLLANDGPPVERRTHVAGRAERDVDSCVRRRHQGSPTPCRPGRSSKGAASPPRRDPALHRFGCG